ncbi:hypothetical protein NECAME_14001 [Necator americanus]|uniref:Uncharacterized protein n=1 Tax=Necator americanus TaxID=51031 RepID=W2SQW4_NECAM|nr:hypothetical protein NECAME_14001 [Necator americanus]ETN72025.1 hypothetical protein NECAME_14001 [Necator americanus]
MTKAKRRRIWWIRESWLNKCPPPPPPHLTCILHSVGKRKLFCEAIDLLLKARNSLLNHS